MHERERGHLDAHIRSDDGFSLVEVVVAVVVLGVALSGVLAASTAVLDVSRGNTFRTVAANLATKQIESARSQDALDIPDGAVVRAEQVGGTTFTITQTANYVVSGSGSSVCSSSGSQLAYKLVTVTVTWPRMGRVAPVRQDTLRSLGLGAAGLDPTLGTLAVGVQDGDGAPVDGVSVALGAGPTRTTGADGCAVFTGLAAGTYTAVVEQAGFMGASGLRRVEATQSVVGGQVARAGLLLSPERSVAVELDVPAGHTAPAGVPLVLRSSYTSTDGVVLPACSAVPAGTRCATGVPGTASPVFATVVDLWLGTCSDAAAAGATADLRAGDGTATVSLRGIEVRVRRGGLPLVGAPVRATHAAEVDAGCTAGEEYDLPLTEGAEAASRGALPAGLWALAVPGWTTLTTPTVDLSAAGVAVVTIEVQP